MRHTSIFPQESPDSLYTPAGFFLIRTPSLSTHIFSQITKNAPDSDLLSIPDRSAVFQECRQQSYTYLQNLLTHTNFLQEALAVASPGMRAGIKRIREGHSPSHARTRRAYSRLLRYLIRMSTRPTPFGLFAGVALGLFANETRLELGVPTISQIRIRPDMGWLYALIQNIEKDSDLLPHLHLMVNSTAYVIGSRIIIPCADAYGNHDTRSISLLNLPLVQSIVNMAQHPLSYQELVSRLQEAFPLFCKEQIHAVLEQLFSIHLLLSTLRPPGTLLSPTSFLQSQLCMINQREDIRQGLRAIHMLQGSINKHGYRLNTRSLEETSTIQKQLVPDYNGPSVQIDSALFVQSPTIHHQVAREAAKAAEILLQIGKYPKGLPTLNQYRRAFIEKYGMATEIPLLQLLSTEAGLGPPAGYTRPPRDYPLPNSRPGKLELQRDRILTALLVQAANDQQMEVQLHDTDLARLTQWTPTEANPAPSQLDIYFQIMASSRQAIDQGSYTLVVSGMTIGGRCMGRFLDLLGEEGQKHMHSYVRAQEALFPDLLFADLNYLPVDARCANVCLRPALHTYEIAAHTMSQRPSEYILELSDLVVGVRHNRFYVRSLRLGKSIHVTQNTMLHSRFAPNVCRFLLEVATDGCPYPSGFDWGGLSSSPFLPRLRYGKSILSLAGWHLRPSDIQPLLDGDEDEQWFVGLQQWRKRWHVPRYVYLTHLDHRLLLDLEHPLLAQELRSELQNVPKDGFVHVQEMLPDLEHLWLSDSDGVPYVAELVVPLTLQKPLAKKASKESHAYPSVVLDEERRYFPGDEWIYLKLYACVHFHDPLIAGPLREFVSQLKARGLCDLWFYVRYADPEPHLRVRFHTAQTSRSDDLLRETLNWSRDHAREGLITRICLDTYERETERYGGPLCINTVEHCFSLNSDATSALIAAHAARQLTLDPLAIAVFSLDQLFSIWGYDFSSRLHYAQTRTQPNEYIGEFRRWRKLLTELLSPWRLSPSDEAHAQRDLLLKLLEPQATLMSPLVSCIHQFAEQHQTYEALVSSLAHIHLNRLLSMDTMHEQRIYAFWCHTLESIGRRPSPP